MPIGEPRHIPTDLRRLLNTPLTRDGLQAFLKAPPSWRPESNRFTISNIFGSSPSAHEWQRKYDLIGELADIVDADFQMRPRLDEQAVHNYTRVAIEQWKADAYEQIADDTRPGPEEPRFYLCNAHGLSYPGFAPPHLDPGLKPGLWYSNGERLLACDPYEPWPSVVEIEDSCQRMAIDWPAGALWADTMRYEQHEQQVQHACDGFAYFWRGALHLYGAAVEVEDPSYPEGDLFLEPHVDLPDVQLLADLQAEADLPSLILLTARHELTSICLKAYEWYRRVDARGYADSNDLYLTSDDWGRLTARVRGYRFIATETVGDDEHCVRTDVPVAHVNAASDIAQLYWATEQWCRWLYNDIVTLKQCARHGCGRFPLAHSGPGRPSKYCSKRCQTIAERSLSKERQKRRRQEGIVTPHMAARKANKERETLR